jgi:hypothetical protein
VFSSKTNKLVMVLISVSVIIRFGVALLALSGVANTQYWNSRINGDQPAGIYGDLLAIDSGNNIYVASTGYYDSWYL